MKPATVKKHPVKRFVKKHRRTGLVIIEVAGVITTTLFGIGDAPKVYDVLDEHEKEIKAIKKQAKDEGWTKAKVMKEIAVERGYCVLDLAKATWRTLVSGTITIATIVVNYIWDGRVEKELLYLLRDSQRALRNRREAERELLPDKDVEKIEKSVADRAVENIDYDTAPIYGDGEVLYVDSITGQLFKSNVHKIQAAINNVNQELNLSPDNYCVVNDVNEQLGIPNTQAGDILGWRNDLDGNIEWYSEPSQIVDKRTGIITPVLVMCYHEQPHTDWDVYH